MKDSGPEQIDQLEMRPELSDWLRHIVRNQGTYTQPDTEPRYQLKLTLDELQDKPKTITISVPEEFLFHYMLFLGDTNNVIAGEISRTFNEFDSDAVDFDKTVTYRAVFLTFKPTRCSDKCRNPFCDEANGIVIENALLEEPAEYVRKRPHIMLEYKNFMKEFSSYRKRWRKASILGALLTSLGHEH